MRKTNNIKEYYKIQRLNSGKFAVYVYRNLGGIVRVILCNSRGEAERTMQ